jgi:hypothetical protein
MRENILMSDYIAGAVSAVVTLAITKGLPWLSRAYEKRYVDPKRAHQEVFLEQANWFEERASKLAAFRFELTHGQSQINSSWWNSYRSWTGRTESGLVTRMKSTTERSFSRLQHR